MYGPVIQRDRNDEKKKPEKRERLNISKSREEPADVDEKRGKLSVPRFQRPFLHSRQTADRVFVSRVMIKRNFRSNLSISSSGSICSILREIYGGLENPRAVEKLGVLRSVSDLLSRLSRRSKPRRKQICCA